MFKKKDDKKQIFQSEKEAIDSLKEKEVVCFDCNCEISFNEEEMENGSLLAYEDNGEEIFAFKCDECFSKNKGLKDYKQCEVYSRIVGYLRPVNQWNDGKKKEYEERKEYNISEE
jgi:hypothetical protein